MKKIAFLLLAATLCLAGCRTKEKVLYFQDLANGETVPTKLLETIKFQPGDKVSIVVSSAATPEHVARYNLPIISQQVGATTGRSNSNQVALYTVDENGDVEIPSIGKQKIGGLTRSEAQARIQSLFRNGILNDAIVTVTPYSQYVTVMGEVKNPGRYEFSRDQMTITELLGLAGDLTIQGRRDRILVLRQEGGETKSYYLDIRSKNFMTSPVYYLKQNDIVYVEPNRMRMGQSTNNDNSIRQISMWISIASFLTTIGVLIFKD